MREPGTFTGELQRGWQRFWGLRWRWKGSVIAVLVLLVIAIASSGGGNDKDPLVAADAAATVAPDQAKTAKPEKATNTPKPTATPPPPTATPTETPLPTPTPTPIALSGRGQKAAGPFELGTGIWVATFSHSGSANFIVKSFDSKGRSALLVNDIGQYQGARPLVGPETYTLDIQADGAWTLTLAPMGAAAGPSASGRGDAVPGLFRTSGGPKTYQISHDGTSNFIVSLQCDKGRLLVQNEIGSVAGSRVVNVPSGASLCYWDVQADGDWSLTAP